VVLPFVKSEREMGWSWWYMSVIPATWESMIGGSPSKASLDKSTRPDLKNNPKAKGLGVCALSGRTLPSKHKALSLISSTGKKNEGEVKVKALTYCCGE
jgi:hypothetical protein